MTVCPGLDLSQEEHCLLGTVRSIADRPPLDEAGLRDFITQSGYAGWILSGPALSKLLAAYNAGRDGECVAIGELHDGSFSLQVSEDAMQAWLTITPACGGKPVSLDDVFVELTAAGVTYGVDRAAITAACEAGVADRQLVATGLAAIDGEDARFELLVSDARDRSPQVNDKGLVDFRELGTIPTVSAEQPLMRRIPPVPGTPGCTVRGQAILPKDGANTGFAENLVGAATDPGDPNLLRAVLNGQPVSSFNGVCVENVLQLRNVNMATGNIGFDGTVNIDGEVLPGMKVNATGDIIVAGVVDGAVLVAGGDIRVGGGVIAKASVRAEGAVTVRFVENAHVYAGTTLAIEDSALQSDLQANNQIIVGFKNPHGKLAGGSARAMMLIQVPVLGATSGGVTQLLLGVNPVLDTAYRDLLQLLDKRKEEEDKLDKLVKHLAKQGDKSGMLERASASRQAAIKAWAKLLPEREALEKQLELVSEARVDVGSAVAGAVDLSFGKKVLRLRKSLSNGVLSVQDDQIVFTDAKGVSASIV